jgi:hypothetical protein
MPSTPPGDEARYRAPTDASLYALEKLAQAVDELGTGNLSDRLYEAAYYIIPEELRHALTGVKDDLQFAQPEWDASFPLSVHIELVNGIQTELSIRYLTPASSD